MTRELITHSNLVIAENTEFVLMPNSLNEKELHMLLLLVAQVKPTDKNYNWVSMSYDTLIERYNNSNKYSITSIDSMKKAIDKLADKKWKNENGDFFHYVIAGKYDDVNRIAKLKLSDETIFLFLIYEKGVFSKYAYIKQLRTKCAIQLYRFCNLKKNFNNAIFIKIQDAIKLFYDAEKTIKTNDFIRFHLEPAIAKINDLTDLHIEYEKVYSKKDRRKISSLKFTITDMYAKCKSEYDYDDCLELYNDYLNNL
ncbi:MAG: replication initiation protein [Lachnospiraceae bacterium]|nr:replication initiation protein [Lachnospiraceae bacterium]